MKPYFEYTDTLNKPYEAFLFDAQKSSVFPILPHWHYFTEILYMVEGNAYVENGDKNYVLEEGDMIVFYPRMSHAIYSTGRFPVRYYILKFDPAHLNISGSVFTSVSGLMMMAAENSELSVYLSKEQLNQEKMRSLIQETVRVVETKPFGYEILLHSYYSLVMMEIFRVWEKNGFQIKKRKSLTNERFAEVSEYISRHCQEPICVEALAKRFHMSYSYFTARFKEYYGQTCKDMILTMRLQKAEDLLRFTEFDLTYISQETGFCDCSHFIKAFKQRYGITPKQFRKTNC